MSFINVKLTDKSLFETSAGKYISNTAYYNPMQMPLFNYYNTSGINLYTPAFSNYGGLFNPLMSLNFVPKFNFTPQLNPFSNLSKLLSNSQSKDYKDYSLSHSTLSLSDVGYSAQKGKKLALTARSNTKGFGGDCALYVRRALEKCGLGNGERGDGYEYASILSRNKNFKEISTSGIDLSDLPAGCVLVYNRGTAGYSRKYGHVEITLGNGKAASDGITNNIRQGASVLVPV